MEIQCSFGGHWCYYWECSISDFQYRKHHFHCQNPIVCCVKMPANSLIHLWRISGTSLNSLWNCLKMPETYPCTFSEHPLTISVKSFKITEQTLNMIWHISRTYLTNLCPWKSLKHPLKRTLNNLWNISGESLDNLRTIYETSLNKHWTFSEHLSERSLSNLWKASGESLKMTKRLFKSLTFPRMKLCSIATCGKIIGKS